MKPYISIVVPTKNSSERLDALFSSLIEQDFEDFEVIIVDSGSSDDTEKKARDFGARFFSLPRFGHGYVRNYGASVANGEIIVFNNHDAVPMRKDWLKKLVAPLSRGDVVASFGRPIPRADTHAAERFFLMKTYPPESKVFSKSDLNRIDTRRTMIFSTISGAIKKKAWKIFKFNERVVIGEDHELGLRLLKAGFRIVYQAGALFMHSHNYRIRDALRRYFDFGRNDRVIGERLDVRDEDLKYLMLLARDTALYAMSRDGIKGMLHSVVYTGAKVVGYSLGSWSNYFPSSFRNSLSYTAFITSH